LVYFNSFLTKAVQI